MKIERIRKSLALKWMVFSILLATIPLTIAGLNIIQIYQRDLKKSVIVTEEMKAGVVVERTEAFFDKVTTTLLTLVNNEDLKMGRSSTHINNLLENLLYQSDYFGELALLDERGRERVKVSKYKVIGSGDLKNQSKSEMFEAASKGNAYYGEFHLTEDMVPTIEIAIPVEEYKGKPVGVLSAKINLRYLWNLIPQIQIGKEGSTYVVDKKGDLIAHPDTRRVLLRLNVKHLPMVDQVVSGKEGHLEFEDPEGEKVLCLYKPIKKLGWGVIVQVPVKEAYGPLERIAHTALMWILIGLVIAILLSLFLTRKLTLPIKRLSKEMGEVAKGNLNTHIQSTTKDELGLLTESFNQMIEDLKQSQESLKEAEEKYRTIFEKSKDMVFITSVDGKFIGVNQAGMKILGYKSKEELMGMHVKDTYFNHEDQKKFMEEIRKEGFVKDFEVKLKRKDGTPIDVLITANARKDDLGNLLGYEGIIKDISDRKRMEEELRKSEERYRTILESIEEGYYEVDLAGNFTFVNDAKCVNLGYPKEEMMSMNNRQYMDKENAKKVFQAFKGVYRTREPVQGLDLEVMKKDGTKAFEELSIFLMRDSEGRPTGFRGISRDVTERKRAEEALRESEARLQIQINRMPIGCIVWDREFRVLSWNPAAERIFGFSAEEAFGKHPYNFIVPKAAQPPIDTIWRRLLDGDTTAHSLNENNTKDGRIIICEWSNTPLKGDNGTVTGVLSMVQDITDRKRAEEALRQSEERYRTIIENIQDGYLEVDIAGNFTFVNDAQCVNLGYTKEELAGMNNRQYADEENAKKMFQAFNRVYKTGEPIKGLDLEVIRKDGTKAFNEISVSLIRDSEGKPIGFRGISRDATERKRAEEALRQSEEKYRAILESIEEGYYEVDLAGNFTFFNDSLCRVWGYPKEELMGMNNRQYADKEIAKKVFQAFNRVYKTGEPGREFDWEIVRKDGTKRYIETSVSLRKDASGKPTGFKGIVRDITDRKRIEEQLSQSEKLRAVGEMASGVAHDFNNALAAILGNTQLLLYTAQDEELRETLKIIEQVAKDSGQTVRRLQDFTRKPVPQELFEVDINSIIKDSIEITKPKWKDEAQSRGIRIEMVSSLEEIPFTSGNASELREVITNMIFNAIEAMHEGGKVEIRTFKKRRDIFIQISDTGVGIAGEAKKRIFEPFFTTKPFTNTGLGLSMSYGIVKRLGGEIEVESKVGQGTSFTIILPIGEEGKEEAVDPQPIKKGRKARILVIDDDEFVRSVLSRTLAQADHQVTLAEDGGKGVQLFKEGKFDIVLTDLGMPGVSGWEVCRMIKEISPHTSVGMITGWGGERSQSKMEEHGLDFFISKPFDFAQILNVVAETMESKEE